MVPFLFFTAMVSNAMLQDQPFYRTLMLLQCFGYGLLAVVHFGKIRRKPLYVPYYFMLVNTAILLGFFKNMLGLQKTSWVSTKR